MKDEKKKSENFHPIVRDASYLITISLCIWLMFDSIETNDRSQFKFCCASIILVLFVSAFDGIHRKLDKILDMLEEQKKERDK